MKIFDFNVRSMLITARKRGLRRLCFHQRLSFCPWGRGVCIQLGLGRPLLHWILQDTVNERSVRILLKCILVFTARKQSLGQGNIFIGVCQEFCSQGEFLPQCMLRYTPPSQEQTPPGSRPPRADAPLVADTPLEAAPPQSRHSSPGADTPLEQAPPSEADTPRADTPQSRHPPKQTPPQAQSMLGDTVNARAVRILLECNLVYGCFCTSSFMYIVSYFYFCFTSSTLTDYLLLLCRYTIDELSNYVENWIDFLRRNITLVGVDELKALLLQSKSLSSERDKRQLNDVSILCCKGLISVEECRMIM